MICQSESSDHTVPLVFCMGMMTGVSLIGDLSL